MGLKDSASGGLVALVGRPNVGKSTLFNRLTGTRRAIVAAVAGTTRDVLVRPVEWQQHVFDLVDTGGVVGASEDPMQEAVAERGRRLVADVDVVVFVVDGRQGPVSADDGVAEELRVKGVPVVLAVNKMDDRRAEEHVLEFHRFGFDPIVEIAAEHGRGIGELLDEVVAHLPVSDTGLTKQKGLGDEKETGIVFVGRPNVGKSSLVNRLLHEDRMLVSSTPGTTRDAIDSTFRWRKRAFRIVDTAGIRRPGKVAASGRVEAVSVVRARHAMVQTEVAVLVIDAEAGIGKRDASIAGEAAEAGCSVVIAANKWDLVRERGAGFSKEFDADLRDMLKFIDYAPLVHISAVTGERMDRLLSLIEEVGAARQVKVGTGDLNRVLKEAVRIHAPSSEGRESVRIRYGVQTGVAPPTFTIFTSRGARLHFSYERFLQNRLREAFGYKGTPIRLKVRGR